MTDPVFLLSYWQQGCTSPCEKQLEPSYLSEFFWVGLRGQGAEVEQSEAKLAHPVELLEKHSSTGQGILFAKYLVSHWASCLYERCSAQSSHICFALCLRCNTWCRETAATVLLFLPATLLLRQLLGLS